jgi:hypothetical protein
MVKFSQPMSSADGVTLFTDEDETICSMNFAERLFSRIETLKQRGVAEDRLTHSALGRAGKVDRTLFAHLREGRSKMMAADSLFAVADYLGCEARWLATGRGPEERQRTDDELAMLELFSGMDDQAKKTSMDLFKSYWRYRAAAPQNLLPPPTYADGGTHE